MEHVVPEDEGSGEKSTGTRRVVEGGALGLSDLALSMAQRRASVIAPWAA